MASASRTLTLKLLADINNFTDGLNKSTAQTKSASDQIVDFGKKAALAFAAAGAAVGAYAKQAIENAAADEAAQRKLALTIENTTNATRGQISAVEDYISKTSIAIGVTDDELRPALGRLVRSTKDVDEAQRLLNLALDITSATGKPLEAVANALGKAYDGNVASLSRLGLGLDASIIKSGDFNKIFTELDKTFGNFAENEAVSTEKQLARVKIALDEANESIGAALLPVVQDLTGWLLQHFVPALQAVIGGLTGDESVLEGLNGTYEAFYLWGERIRNMIDFVIRFKDELAILAGVLATVFVASKVVAGIQAIIGALALLRTAYITTGIAAAFATAGVSVGTAIAALAGVGIATGLLMSVINGGGGSSQVYSSNPNLMTGGSGGGGGGGGGGISLGSLGSLGGGGTLTGTGTKTATVTKNLAEQSNDLILASIAANANAKSINTPTGVLNKLSAMDGTPQVVVNVSGAIDPEGTARTIVNTLNSSFYRGTGGAGGLVT
jgi:hypothetical protein